MKKKGISIKLDEEVILLVEQEGEIHNLKISPMIQHMIVMYIQTIKKKKLIKVGPLC